MKCKRERQKEREKTSADVAKQLIVALLGISIQNSSKNIYYKDGNYSFLTQPLISNPIWTGPYYFKYILGSLCWYQNMQYNMLPFHLLIGV